MKATQPQSGETEGSADAEVNSAQSNVLSNIFFKQHL